MSWEFFDSRIVKQTRKDHRCAVCGRIIPKGSKDIYNWGGKWDGDMQNSYACHWCHEHSKDLCDDDGYIIDLWDSLREYIFEELFDKYRECDCVDEHGYAGNIEAELEGNYLVFKCEDCGKEWHREHMPITE
jgi:ribosomal protein S27E